MSDENKLSAALDVIDALRAELSALKTECEGLKKYNAELDRQVTLNRENWRMDAEEKERKMYAATARAESAENREMIEALGIKAEHDAALALVETCRKALTDLLRQASNIEGLGEWEALDINASLRRTTRAKVDEVVKFACEALAALPVAGTEKSL